MSCPQGHVKDPNWSIDLIWKYFHEDATKAKQVSHYKFMDPKGDLDDRHNVYRTLVDDAAKTDSNWRSVRGDKYSFNDTMIPWNQNHPGMVKKFGGHLACGSVTKITFMKYMGWGENYPVQTSLNSRNVDAVVALIVRNLLNGKPVLAKVASDTYGWHFVGIVGCRPQAFASLAGSIDSELKLAARRKSAQQWDFLYLDPWAGSVDGNNSITYAGATTRFLGIITQQGAKLKYGKHDVNSAGGHVP
jgi:hypothetical protein